MPAPAGKFAVPTTIRLTCLADRRNSQAYAANEAVFAKIVAAAAVFIDPFRHDRMP
jgi:hypothetical protein